MVVGPNLDGWQPEAVDVHELPQPWPGAVVEAHQVTAVGLVPGEFLPRVRGAPGRLVEVVVDAWILVALDEERVEPGTRARRPLWRRRRFSLSIFSSQEQRKLPPMLTLEESKSCSALGCATVTPLLGPASAVHCLSRCKRLWTNARVPFTSSFRDAYSAFISGSSSSQSYFSKILFLTGAASATGLGIGSDAMRRSAVIVSASAAKTRTVAPSFCAIWPRYLRQTASMSFARSPIQVKTTVSAPVGTMLLHSRPYWEKCVLAL